MKTRMDTTIRLPRVVTLLLVLAALVAPGLKTAVAGTPVAAQTRETELDLPAMSLTSADLEQAGLPGFGLAHVGADSPDWRTIGDAAADSVAANIICCLAKLDRLDFDLSRTGWMRQYRRVLARPAADDPTSVDMAVFSEVAEYADAEGADAALTLLMDNGSDVAYSDELRGDRLELRADYLLNDGPRLVVAFRHGNLLGIEQIIKYGQEDPTPQSALLLALRLQLRIKDGLAQPGPGLDGAALRLASVATPAEFEGYLRLNGEIVPDFGESAETATARSAAYAGAIDVYHLEQALVPSPGQSIPPQYDDRLLRFSDEEASSAWLKGLPQGLKEDVANAGGSLAIDQVGDAQTLGDDSLTFKVRGDRDGGTTYGYRVYVRVGAYGARIQFDAVEEPPLATVQALAEAQVACFRAGSCAGDAQLPRDLAGLSCPPVSSTDSPSVVGSTLEIGAVPMPGADPAHTGAHPGPGPSGAPQERWHFAAPGGTEGPIVADGLLYFGSFDPASETGNLYALDTAAGAQRWCTTTGWTVTAPSFADGTVFTEANTISGGHRQDFVVALAATTGEERWRFSIDSGQTGGVAGVAVADGTVYVGTGMGSLFALDESSGEARWLYEVDPDAESPEYQLGLPAIAADVVYVAGGNTLHALAAATGKELWRYLAEDDESLGTPTVSGGIVYVGGEHAVYAVDAKSGEEVWRFASESAGGNRLAVVDSVVYLGTGSETEATGVASLSAVDAESGHQLWRFDTEGYVSTPAVAGDTVYVGTGVQRSDGRQEGAVHALSAADGEELWNYPIDGIATTPIVAGGRVYVSAETARDGDEEQTLYAIGGTTATTDVARDPR